MSIMRPPKKRKPRPKKMKAPKPVNRTKRAKRTQKPPKFPGLTPPDLPEFEIKHQKAFEEMQENCYKELHRPRVIKIRGWNDAIYYICEECLKKYLEKHKKLKEIVISFGR